MQKILNVMALSILILGAFALSAFAADPTIAWWTADANGSAISKLPVYGDGVSCQPNACIVPVATWSSGSAETLTLDYKSDTVTASVANPVYNSAKKTWKLPALGQFLFWGMPKKQTPGQNLIWWKPFAVTVQVMAPMLTMSTGLTALVDPEGQTALVVIKNPVAGTTAANVSLSGKIVANQMNLNCSATNFACSASIGMTNLIYLAGTTQIGRTINGTITYLPANDITSTLQLGNVAGSVDQINVRFILAKKYATPTLVADGSVTAVNAKLKKFTIVLRDTHPYTTAKGTTMVLYSTEKSLMANFADQNGDLVKKTLSVGDASTITTLNITTYNAVGVPTTIPLPINGKSSVMIGDILGSDSVHNYTKVITGTLAIGAITPSLTLTANQAFTANIALVTATITNAGNTATSAVILKEIANGSNLAISAYDSKTATNTTLPTPYGSPIFLDGTAFKSSGTSWIWLPNNPKDGVPLGILNPNDSIAVQARYCQYVAANGINLVLSTNGTSTYRLEISVTTAGTQAKDVAITFSSTSTKFSAAGQIGGVLSKTVDTGVAHAVALADCTITRIVDGVSHSVQYAGNLAAAIPIGTIAGGTAGTVVLTGNLK